MRQAALVWRATGQPEWLAVARSYLLAWMTVYQPSLNPIDETSFDALIDTYALIQSSLPAAEHRQVSQKLQDWAAAYAAAMQHAAAQQSGHAGTWSNNWQSHRVKLLTMMAVALNDAALFSAARAAFQQQVAANIAPDGETLDFRERDALHYVVYDLEPLVQAALAARLHGEDWYRWATPDGASLARAVAWLTPYASGARQHQEFVHSSVRFDAQRAEAGVKGFAGPFDPHTARNLYWLAAEFDPELRPLAARLGKAPQFIALCGQ